MSHDPLYRMVSSNMTGLEIHHEHGDFDVVWTNHDKSSNYPLVNCHITMERSTIFNRQIHYKSQFSIAMLNYQRVNAGLTKQARFDKPEGN